MDKNALYSFLYQNKIKPICEEVQNSEAVNNEFAQQNGMLQLENNIEFGKALGILHNHLFTFDLSDD